MSTVSRVIATAKAEVGTHEKRSGGHWVNGSKYNVWYGKIPGYGADGLNYPWCAVFVAWVADKADAKALYPKTAGCETAVAWYKRQGRFSEYPAVGAQVFFGPGGGTHTGIVVSYTDSTITTVEGNTNVNGSAEGDGVYLKTRARKTSYVYGYGYPNFPEGITSADPAWADKAPKPADKPATPAKPATPSKPATPAKPTAKPSVSLAKLVKAAKTDPTAPQGHQTYAVGVRIVEAALRAEGLLVAKYAADGSYGTTTKDAMSAWQERCGYRGRRPGQAADGVPGMTTLKRLAARHGFTVTA